MFTMKLAKRLPQHGVTKWAKDVEQKLGEWFEDFNLLWLFGNTSNERTIICFRRKDK